VQVFNPNANPVVKGLVVSGVLVPDQVNPGAYVAAPDYLSQMNQRGLK
jgi:hypothetical protein